MTTFNVGPNAYHVREFIGFYAVAWGYAERRFFVFDEVECEFVGDPDGYRTRAEACTEATLRAYPPENEPTITLGAFEGPAAPDSGELYDATQGRF